MEEEDVEFEEAQEMEVDTTAAEVAPAAAAGTSLSFPSTNVFRIVYVNMYI